MLSKGKILIDSRNSDEFITEPHPMSAFCTDKNDLDETANKFIAPKDVPNTQYGKADK